MFEWLAFRVTQGFLTCDPEKATESKRLVPAVWRTQVVAVLQQTGFDADGQPLVG